MAAQGGGWILTREGVLAQGRFRHDPDGFNSEGDELHGLILRKETVHALVRGRKPVSEAAQRCGGNLTLGNRHRELVILSGITHVNAARAALILRRDLLMREPCVRS